MLEIASYPPDSAVPSDCLSKGYNWRKRASFSKNTTIVLERTRRYQIHALQSKHKSVEELCKQQQHSSEQQPKKKNPKIGSASHRCAYTTA